MYDVRNNLIGELDYQGLFMNDDVPSTSSKDNKTKDDNSSNRNFAVAYPVSAHLWYIGFVITITFVLMNLLVGLAVSDIQVKFSIKTKANYRKSLNRTQVNIVKSTTLI